ncbi:hypothetical protein CDV26_06340 [Francisella halioticida]|uniref:CobW C-terminal domain-containing protein n=2 Tax=Francisella halioticida TaxID=549298 RepID=A0ABM6LZI3_9GAMM|nr:hypothetical protein CDV26_06340 [Francisella halioticida]
MRSFELHRYYKLDDIVTLVDAVNGNDTLDNHPEATKQAAMAERIILSKTDIVDSNTQQTLINRLKAINPSTPILFNTSDEAIVSSLSGLDTYNPNSKSEDVIKWLNMEHFEDEHQHLHHNHSDEDHDHDHHHDINRHSDEIQAFVMTSDKPINYMAFNLFLELLTSMVGLKLLRVKGIINIVGEDRPVVVHGVQHLFHPIRWLDNWPDDDHRTRLVFITHNIPQEVIQKLFNSLLGTVKEEGIE